MTANKPKGLFIAGTDTGVGKTWVSLLILKALQLKGLKVAAMKPVASGSAESEQGLLNEDALALQAAASESWPYGIVNPYAFRDPVSPDIAAARESRTIAMETIIDSYKQLDCANDLVLVEGVGGWRSPLSPSLFSTDVVKALNLQVVFVVGLRLGCINHALLTDEVMAADQVSVLGWVANALQTSYDSRAETVACLEQRLSCSLLFETASGQLSEQAEMLQNSEVLEAFLRLS